MNKKLLCLLGCSFAFTLVTHASTHEQLEIRNDSIKKMTQFEVGAGKTISIEQIKKVSKSNIFTALSVLDPSIIVKPNNDLGSSPSAYPDITLRGAILPPLVMIDGVEADTRTLYEINLFDIKSVTILKDATAAALYGEQAGNGVILVERKTDSQSKISVTYNFLGDIDFADLSSYSFGNFKNEQDYTEWIKKPLRTAFSHNHSLNVSGSTGGLSYLVTSRYASIDGVMKGDNRENYGFGVLLSYNLKDKLGATFRGDYKKRNSVMSPYGAFHNSANADPYENPYNTNGELKPNLADGSLNPLYEASLSSFFATKERDCSASLSLRWNLFGGFALEGFGYVEDMVLDSDEFISPLSGQFPLMVNPLEKGSYFQTKDDDFYYKAQLNALYDLSVGTTKMKFRAGYNFRSIEVQLFSLSVSGLPANFDGDFDYLSNGEKYNNILKDRVGTLFLSAYFDFNDNFYLDGSYRLSTSSLQVAGKNNSSFGSIGGGWNIDRLIGGDVLSDLRLRASYGTLGNLMNRFYIASSEIISYTNDPAKFWNIGISSSILSRRLAFDLDYYERDVTLKLPIELPNITDFSLVKRKDKGFELSFSAIPVQSRSVSWILNLNSYIPIDKPSMSRPDYYGALSSFFTYKNLSFNISVQYSAGRDVYNTSLVDRVENGTKIFDDRWNKDNENKPTAQPETKRFIERERYLNLSSIGLSYRLSDRKLAKIGLKQLDFGVSANNILYTTSLDQKRGIYYPFARGFSVSLSAIF